MGLFTKASNLFELEGQLPENFQLVNNRTTITQTINGVEEELTSQLFVNEVTFDNYTHCRIVLDEIVDVQARALTRLMQKMLENGEFKSDWKLYGHKDYLVHV